VSTIARTAQIIDWYELDMLIEGKGSCAVIQYCSPLRVLFKPGFGGFVGRLPERVAE
jgi:hypothetical protein